ncbi:Serine-type D-Ala-D-Ala carboxypeptidase [Solidesulfovibrio fructosivorans JJ]]|uniref:Serine-type D-Ala-D-Ala carboxypeptidase n=1 Tax=Solidesulfovibrio fructosivorans JJ] TaxID=596151 RepID=E1JZ79_SOLFR|nr:D-alanyl-D-alanine carboxypeptidase family protein [Solidesulfovibrio fructosivorans]EFL50362.1 Serine-type D-Ala-D-Ala carboxypeptidase [Solidesulfovibrio fructosivorans JJ]]
MQHSFRVFLVILAAVFSLVAAPLCGEGLALAKRSSHAAHDKDGKAAKSAKSSKTSRKKSKKPRRAKKAAAPALRESENEEGDIGVCTVPRLTVKSAMLWDMNTGGLLYEQNPDVQIPPASLTKILTLYIIFDAIRQGKLHPWDVVEVSQRAASQGGSNMRLRAGESVKVTELIKGIAVASANDACMAMAEYLENGNPDAFVNVMNDTAQRLGMTRSRFMNPNGLPADGQVTTARDMLRLASAYLEQFPKALTIHSMQFFTHNNRQRHNANALLGRYEGADGLKTGFVCASGYNIIATAKRGDTRLIGVVLGSRSAGVRLRETSKLLDKGFKIVAAQKSAKDNKVLAATPPPPPVTPALP